MASACRMKPETMSCQPVCSQFAVVAVVVICFFHTDVVVVVVVGELWVKSANAENTEYDS